MNISEDNQGNTFLCWDYSVLEAYAASGLTVDVTVLYQLVKGVDYSPPGQPASFPEVQQAIEDAAQMTSATLKWFGDRGRANDFDTFDQLLRDGSWYLLVGVNEQVLTDDLGLGEDANYGHFFLVQHLDYDGDGVPETDTIDSYRSYDHVPVRIPLAALHDGMRRNWDANFDALAFQVVAP